ncbi:hypothetical protein EH206_08530 [Brenneria nigrifluens DSM 30175 = ATCC 13028]|uniref:Uncharacterized protein n=1 Tax=Brenneria nigrifluens DSM 30175 = ATCC 13028 TaxID=1121120 RepID=A0A2U1US34_9GAMM|nr:hypothetical protein DDT54_08825 [Brenneria nigrifluens DSM 30175 = ATCC 13028]QCR04217.1 hypothetical protein EH206_08530 [Brenneria nigrifluens DSM 30175 = ATCC 13028]
MSSRDAAKTSAASDKNVGSVFEQRLRWPGRASLRDETSIPSLVARIAVMGAEGTAQRHNFSR